MLPARGATRGASRGCAQPNISIHAPRTGSDRRSAWACRRSQDFNPCSPHGERQGGGLLRGYKTFISIHAPRTGSDGTAKRLSVCRMRFQSMLPARGATTRCVKRCTSTSFQSMLPARGATMETLENHIGIGISIHAPRTGSDDLPLPGAVAHRVFQSMLPARGATQLPHEGHAGPQISIHAPRTGSDVKKEVKALTDLMISIHAPRTGSDSHNLKWWYSSMDFNPCSPHGERRARYADESSRSGISIHAPRTGSDCAK